MTPRWKYLILDDDEVGNLDDLGNQGWELVTVLRQTWENERKGYTEYRQVYYFKRPRVGADDVTPINSGTVLPTPADGGEHG